MLLLQQAVFLRGVSDPADPGRITTTLYRPKHQDLRYQDGFVRSGSVLVPLDNVVELRSLAPEPTNILAALDTQPIVQEPAVNDDAAQEPTLRRRGRPRKAVS